jgi:hypothetical protein
MQVEGAINRSPVPPDAQHQSSPYMFYIKVGDEVYGTSPEILIQD